MTDADGFPGPANDAAWEAAAVSATIGQLNHVHDVAAKWSTTITGLIGVFGSIALVSGTSELDKIKPQWLQIGIVIATVAAGVTAAVSVYQGAQAAIGRTGVYNGMDGPKLREAVHERAADAVKHLSTSKGWGYAAAALVFAVGVTTLMTAAIPATREAPTVIVVQEQGAACGLVTVDQNGAIIKVGETPVSHPISIITVSNCSSDG